MAMIPAKARLALKLGNLKYLDEVKDLIVPMADFAQGVKSKLGFVWRADLFPTGAKVPSKEEVRPIDAVVPRDTHDLFSDKCCCVEHITRAILDLDVVANQR